MALEVYTVTGDSVKLQIFGTVALKVSHLHLSSFSCFSFHFWCLDFGMSSLANDLMGAALRVCEFGINH